jgi:hypothetical protein
VTKYDHFEMMLFALEERTLTVTLNRPENLNAFTMKMEVEITQFLADGAVDRGFDIVILSPGSQCGRYDTGKAAGVLNPRFSKTIIAKLNGHATASAPRLPCSAMWSLLRITHVRR